MRSLVLVALLVAGLAQASTQAASFRPTHYRGQSWAQSPRAVVFRPVAAQRRIAPAQQSDRQAAWPGRPAVSPRLAPQPASNVFRGAQVQVQRQNLPTRFRPDERAVYRPAQPDQGWRTRSSSPFRPVTAPAAVRPTQRVARYTPRSGTAFAPVPQPVYRQGSQPVQVQRGYPYPRPYRAPGAYGGWYPTW